MFIPIGVISNQLSDSIDIDDPCTVFGQAWLHIFFAFSGEIARALIQIRYGAGDEISTPSAIVLKGFSEYIVSMGIEVVESRQTVSLPNFLVDAGQLFWVHIDYPGWIFKFDFVEPVDREFQGLRDVPKPSDRLIVDPDDDKVSEALIAHTARCLKHLG